MQTYFIWLRTALELACGRRVNRRLQVAVMFFNVSLVLLCLYGHSITNRPAQISATFLMMAMHEGWGMLLGAYKSTAHMSVG